MKKKIFVLMCAVATLFAFTGCFGSTDESTEDANKEQTQETSKNNFKGVDFSIYVPEEWETIEKKDFTSDIPQGTEIVFRNNVKNEDFTANVNITKNAIQNPINPEDYAKQAISNIKASMYNFSEVKRETVEINVAGKETETLYLAFEGKRNENENTVQFLQIYATKGHVGYIVTGAFSKGEEELVVKKVDAMVRSFEVN